MVNTQGKIRIVSVDRSVPANDDSTSFVLCEVYSVLILYTRYYILYKGLSLILFEGVVFCIGAVIARGSDDDELLVQVQGYNTPYWRVLYENNDWKE